MSINMNENGISYLKYFYFPKDQYGNYIPSTSNGKPMLALCPAYRGKGVQDYLFSQRGENVAEMELPEALKIPDEIEGIPVEALVPGIFAGNKRIKEITLPTSVTIIPDGFCSNATNLRAIHGTEQITSIGEKAFLYTRLKEALFPNLDTMLLGAFANCAYLETVNIGKVNTIPMRAFYWCARLGEVIWKGNQVSIQEEAFLNTRNLRSLDLLKHATYVGNYAFYYSRIGISWHPDNNKAFPTTDNKTEFWKDATYTPREHRIVTKLSQVNPAWKDETFLRNFGTKYDSGCALFAVMHIHSAISGKYYNHPDEFVEELKHDPKLSRFLYYRHWPGQFKNVASMFEALGYRTEVHGNGSTLSKQNFQALLDAVANGAYVYAQVGTFNNWTKDWEPDNVPNAAQTKDCYPNAGHAVVIYGTEETGEVCVLDSNILHEAFREDGFEPDVDVYTYSIPFQNIVGPSSNFVIVYPPEEEQAAE